MPRPKKNNADYFPHFTSLRNHRKVKILKNKFGNVLGYAFWCMMLEWLTEHDGLEFEYSKIEIEMFASELGVSAAEIPPMIDYCISIELLFITETKFIYSDSLNEVLSSVFVKREQEREKSKLRQRKENGAFVSVNNTTERGVSAAETPQSKVKESKENKSKEDYSDKKDNEIPFVAKATNQNTFDERKEIFKKSLFVFVKTEKNTSGIYTKEMVHSFFDYWSEANKSGTKMKWEQEKTWETQKRLIRWSNNSFKTYQSKKSNAGKQPIQPSKQGFGSF